MMFLFALQTSSASMTVDACIAATAKNALRFCQELSSDHQDELFSLYQTQPTERIAMLLGTQEYPANDLSSFIKRETNHDSWYWLAGGEIESSRPTRNRQLRRWFKTEVFLNFVVEVMDERGLHVSQRTWKRMATHPEAEVRSTAVPRLKDVDTELLEERLRTEQDEIVQMGWTKHAFKLAEEPIELREMLTAKDRLWESKALKSKAPWARTWLIDELAQTDDPYYLIREMAQNPPPVLWTRCESFLAKPREYGGSEEVRRAQGSCLTAWKIRTGNDDLTYEEAVELSDGSE